MDNSELKKLIDESPEPVKTLITSGEWFKAVEEIGRDYKLTNEQVSELGDEVMFVLLGLELHEDLTKNIREINIDPVIAREISEKIKFSIFDPVINWLPSANESNSKEIEERPIISPMIEVGEAVHDVKPQAEAPNTTPTPKPAQAPTPAPQPVKPLEERKASVSVPQSSYKAGQDPYREPIG